MKRIFILFLFSFCALYFSVPARAADNLIDFAVIPGEGKHRPSDLLIANMEVALSDMDTIAMVDRTAINNVLQEIQLGGEGYHNTREIIRIGNLIAADILVFVEKMPSDTALFQMTADPNAAIVHVRFVETKTGVILTSLMGLMNSLENNPGLLVQAVQTAIDKHKIKNDKRTYLGILNISSNEPGTTLDGAARALETLLANDLSKSADVIVLDRKHLQYLQEERSLTGIDLDLKRSTFVIDGGLTYSPGQKQIIATLDLRPLAAGAGSAQSLTFTFVKDNLSDASEAIVAGILRKLNPDSLLPVSSNPREEGEMFLSQVPLYLYSGDLERAVSHAEVAYGILSDQQSIYAAAWAWYALGWDLASKLPHPNQQGGRVRRTDQRAGGPVRITATDRGDQFGAGDRRVKPVERATGRYYGTDRGSIQNEEVWRSKLTPEESRRIEELRANRVENSDEIPALPVVEPSKITSGEIHHPAERRARSRGAKKPEMPPEEIKKRFLTALMHSYSLMQELTYNHIRGYESGKIQDIKIPDPRNHFDDISRHDDRQRNLSLKYQIGKRNKEISWLFQQLVDIRNQLNQTQRDFYFKHYMDSVKAQTAYWDTLIDKRDMIREYYRYDNNLFAGLIAEAVDAFVKTSSGVAEPRIKGLLEIFKQGKAQVLSEEEKNFYLNLAQHDDPFLRFAANKQLLRTDPVTYSEKVMNIFVKEFPYAHPYRHLDDHTLIPDYIKSSFDRMAVSHPQEMIALADQIFKPMLAKKDMPHLVAWRDCLWPYINGLKRFGQKEKFLEVIQRVIDILEEKDYAQYSNEAKLLRAQLELALTRFKKEDIDPKYTQYFSYNERPYYVRLRPEIEPPTIKGIPVDMTRIKPVQLPVKGMTTVVVNSSGEVFANGYAGSTFSKGYTYKIDAEGNETFTISDMNVEKERFKREREWSAFSARRMPVRIVPVGNVAMLGKPTSDTIIEHNYLIDNGVIYILQQRRVDNALIVTAFTQCLRDNSGNRYLGTVDVDLGNVTDCFSCRVTAMAVDDQFLYVGTPGGLITFPKNGGESFTESNNFNSSSGEYNPYYGQEKTLDFKTQNTRHMKSQEQNNGQDHEQNAHAIMPRLLTEQDGLPGNHILSLAFFDGKLYMGLGPLEKNQMGVVGNCAFAAYDPESGEYDIIASSRSREKRNVFEQGKSYQIIAIIPDARRNFFWLGVSGNPDYNGIWKYDLTSRSFKRIIAEDSDIQYMKFLDNKILYIMDGTGLVQFDPENFQRRWLLGQADSSYGNNNTVSTGPKPPKDFSGDPVYGHPETRLWPCAMNNGQLVTLSQDGMDVLLHRKGKDAVARSVFDPMTPVVEYKTFLSSDDNGIWMIAGQGVYFLKARVEHDEETNPAVVNDRQ